MVCSIFSFDSYDCCYWNRTAETIARYIQPLVNLREDLVHEEPPNWVSKLTTNMERSFAKSNRRTPRDLEKFIHTANSGRIYFEQLHLHPVRLELTFTQEWMDVNGDSDTMMVFQFIRGMVRSEKIHNSPRMTKQVSTCFPPFPFAGFDCQRSTCLHFFCRWPCFRSSTGTVPYCCHPLLFPTNQTSFWYSW